MKALRLRPAMMLVLTYSVTLCSVAPIVNAQSDHIHLRLHAQVQRIDLAQSLKAAKLKPFNRTVAQLQERSSAAHVNAGIGPGVVWIEGTDFAEGSIEVDVRGRDLYQQSFVGIAFHRKDDLTYEAIYVRPFNFRASDPDRHKHAVQYISVPNYDWPRLRQDFPNQFEASVDPSVSPDDWVHLRVVVKQAAIEAYVGPAKSPALQIQKLGNSTQGMIGLWVGNGSEGDFSNLEIKATK